MKGNLCDNNKITVCSEGSTNNPCKLYSATTYRFWEIKVETYFKNDPSAYEYCYYASKIDKT